MRIETSLSVIALLLTTGAVAAQQKTPPIDFYQTPPNDPAIGEPYRTGDKASRGLEREANTDDVPLRDFMSARVDQLRGEILRLIDERDNQYSQRFDAQQKALADALIAARETSANALAAAEAAVTKAEAANNERFKSVNEFRSTLTDQALTFISKETAEAQFKNIEDRIKLLDERANTSANRINEMQAASEGAAGLWGYIVGGLGLALALAAFALNASRARRPL